MKQKISRILIIIITLTICQSCCTEMLWEATDPNEKLWVPDNQITETGLLEKGIEYEKYSGKHGNGYLIEKSSAVKLRDYSIRTLATPVTLSIDTVSMVVVGGVLFTKAFLESSPNIATDILMLLQTH